MTRCTSVRSTRFFGSGSSARNSLSSCRSLRCGREVSPFVIEIVDDIVVRLRRLAGWGEPTDTWALIRDAADEIERLRQEAEIKTSRLDDALAETDRLRSERLLRTFYKHECGHCHRMSSVPFSIPTFVIDEVDRG